MSASGSLKRKSKTKTRLHNTKLKMFEIKSIFFDSPLFPLQVARTESVDNFIVIRKEEIERESRAAKSKRTINCSVIAIPPRDPITEIIKSNTRVLCEKRKQIFENIASFAESPAVRTEGEFGSMPQKPKRNGERYLDRAAQSDITFRKPKSLFITPADRSTNTLMKLRKSTPSGQNDEVRAINLNILFSQRDVTNRSERNRRW